MSPCMQSRSGGGGLRAWLHSLTYPCSARTGRYFASAPSYSHPNLRVDFRAGIGQSKRTCPLPFSPEPSYPWPARKRGEEEDPCAASRIAHGPRLPSFGERERGLPMPAFSGSKGHKGGACANSRSRGSRSRASRFVRSSSAKKRGNAPTNVAGL